MCIRDSFTRTDWRWNEFKAEDVAAPSLRYLLVFMSAAAFVVSIFGANTRPTGFGTIPHLWGGFVVTGLALWTVEIVLNKFSQIAELKIAAILIAELAGVQSILGIVAYSMALNARAASHPMPGLGIITGADAAVGALELASCLFATFQAFKYIAHRKVAVVTAVPSLPRPKYEAAGGISVSFAIKDNKASSPLTLD